jgi:hypothetical protein
MEILETPSDTGAYVPSRRDYRQFQNLHGTQRPRAAPRAKTTAPARAGC